MPDLAVFRAELTAEKEIPHTCLTRQSYEGNQHYKYTKSGPNIDSH